MRRKSRSQWKKSQNSLWAVQMRLRSALRTLEWTREMNYRASEPTAYDWSYWNQNVACLETTSLRGTKK